MKNDEMLTLFIGGVNDGKLILADRTRPCYRAARVHRFGAEVPPGPMGISICTEDYEQRRLVWPLGYIFQPCGKNGVIPVFVLAGMSAEDATERAVRFLTGGRPPGHAEAT